MSIPVVRLGELCDLLNGVAFKSDDYIESSNTLVCRMSNIRPDATFNILYNPKYLPDTYIDKYKDYLLKDGDIIIAMTDMASDPKILGVPTIVDTKGFNLLLNQRVGKLCKIDFNKAHVPYLKKVLSRPELKGYYKKFSGGGLQLNISKGDILNIRIPLPTFDDQIRIADILTRAEKLIAKRKESIKSLDEFLKSTFLEMFGDPAIVKLSDNVKLIEEVCQFKGGGTPSKSKPEYFTGSIPWVSPKDMKSLYINTSIDKITEEAVKNSSASLISKGSVLMVVRSGILKNKLPVAINTVDVTINQDMKAFTSDVVEASYLLYYFIVKEKGMLSKVRATTADNFNFDDIKKMRISIPPLSLQNKFAAIVEKVESMKVKYNESLVEMENLYGSLSQRAFRGELDLSRVPIEKIMKEKDGFSDNYTLENQEVISDKTDVPINRKDVRDKNLGWKIAAGAALATATVYIIKKIYDNLSEKKAKEHNYVVSDKYLIKRLTAEKLLEIISKVENDFLFSQLWNEILNAFKEKLPDNYSLKDGWENRLYPHVKETIFSLLAEGKIKQVFNEESKEIALCLNK